MSAEEIVISDAFKEQVWLVAFDMDQTSLDIHTSGVVVKDNETLEDDRVGEIFISSPSLAAGYYPSSTEAFSVSEDNSHHSQHTIPNDSRHFLATGDLGFIHVVFSVS